MTKKMRKKKKINGTHILHGLPQIVWEINLEDVTTGGVFDQDKFLKELERKIKLYRFLNGQYSEEVGKEDK